MDVSWVRLLEAHGDWSWLVVGREDVALRWCCFCVFFCCYTLGQHFESSGRSSSDTKNPSSLLRTISNDRLDLSNHQFHYYGDAHIMQQLL